MGAAINPWRRIYPAVLQASILQIEGRWEEAEPLIRGSLALYRSEIGEQGALIWAHGREAEWVDLQRAELAKNLIRQGRILEAEVVLREAIGEVVRSQGRDSKITAILLDAFAELLLEQGRPAEAAILASRVVGIYDRLNVPPDSRLRAASQFLLASSDAFRGNWQAAYDEYEAVSVAFAGNVPTYDRYFAGNPTLLLTKVKIAPTAQISANIAAVYAREKAHKGLDHYDVIELSAIGAVAAIRNGAGNASIVQLRDAVHALITLERQSRDSGVFGFQRRARLKAIVELYIDAVTPQAGSGTAGQADAAVASETFELASFSQGQGIELALGQSLARQSAGDPELKKVIRNVQDSEQRIEAAHNLLAAVYRSPTRDAARIAALRAQIQRLRQSRAAVSAEITERFPEYVSLIRPAPIRLDQVKRYLAADDALLSFYPMDGKTLVWIVLPSGETSLQVAPLGRADIDRIVQALRNSLDPDARTLGGIPEFDVTAAYRLYAALLAPSRKMWGSSKNLLIVASGSLNQLPLSVLVTEPVSLRPREGSLFARYQTVPWLARSHSVTVLPSTTALAALRKNTQRAVNRVAFAGFGNPQFRAADAAKPAPGQTRGGGESLIQRRSAPATRGAVSASVSDLAPLPDTEEEIRSIAQTLNADPQRDVFLGRQASEAAVKSLDLSNRKVLVFATHGLLPGDIDGLQQPAMALTPTATASDQQAEDGLLTMGEILGLRLNADWVVLSACNTGAAGGKGAEAVSGLGGAFFYAGTRALLVSNWPVETTSARVLTTTLFALQARQKGLNRSQALRQAMLQLLDGEGMKDAQGKVVFSYAHPIFWAPFSLVGDGGIN